jgi:hypothetical protein
MGHGGDDGGDGGGDHSGSGRRPRSPLIPQRPDN